MTQPDDLTSGLADAGARVGPDEYTGRYITLLDPADTIGAMSTLADAAGVAPAERVSAEEPEAVAQARTWCSRRSASRSSARSPINGRA
jgi:hypothetical protein